MNEFQNFKAKIRLCVNEDMLEDVYNETFNEGYDYYREELQDDVTDLCNQYLIINFNILKREMEARGFKTG